MFIANCGGHLLQHDLCIKEATQDNFLTAKIEAPMSSSPSFYQRRYRRVSCLRHTPRLILSKAWDQTSVRALFSFDTQRNSLSSAAWKNLCSGSKLLRILDLGDNISAGSVPDALSGLINLRYLRICISSRVIPESIFELWNLKMLYIHGHPSYVLPIEVFKLQQLEQLIIRGRTTFPPNPVRPSIRPLLSLRVLSSIVHNEAFENLVKKLYFPNLIKLQLDGASSLWPSFINLLPYLPCLEILTLLNQDSARREDDRTFEAVDEAHILASKLKKVTLKLSTWSGRAIELLGRFPNLQILKLRGVDMYYVDTPSGEEGHDSISVLGNCFPKLHTLEMENAFPVEGISSLDETAFLHLRGLLIAPAYMSTLKKCPRLLQLPNLQDVKLLNFCKSITTPYRPQDVDKLKAQAKYKLLILV